MTAIAGPMTRLLACLATALLLAACASPPHIPSPSSPSRSQPPLLVISGWVIGPDRTCVDLGLPQPRCDGLVARAIAAHGGSPAVTDHSLHDLGELTVDGTAAVPSWGDGSPFGLLVIDYSDGTMSAEPIACFGPPGLASPADPLCP